MTALELRRLYILSDVDRMRAKGRSVESAAQELGISARAIQKWMRWREKLSDADKIRVATSPFLYPNGQPLSELTPAAAPKPEPSGEIQYLPEGMKMPKPVSLTTLSPAELVSELGGRSRSLIVVAELVDGTYLIELHGSEKQYELLCAMQALKAGARFKP